MEMQNTWERFMRDIGGYFIIASCGIFLLYFANVVMGSMGKEIFFSDIEEMLTLIAACIVFVIGILFREKMASEMSSKSNK